MKDDSVEHQTPGEKDTDFIVNKDNLISHEVTRKPTWWVNVLESMQESDKLTITEMRNFLAKPNVRQNWYYAGSGMDIFPSFLAQPNSKVWMVDPGYDDSSHYYRPINERFFVEPFTKLGANVDTAVSWKEAWKIKKQTVMVDGEEKLELIGARTQDSDSIPDAIDVIYTNPYSTTPGAGAFKNLATEGYYVVADDPESKTELNLRYFNRSLKSFGFEKAESYNVNSLHFPKAGALRTTSEGKSLRFDVYKKTREFTHDEEDLLEMDDSLSNISVAIDEYIFQYNPKEKSNDDAQMLENIMENAIRGHFKRLKSLNAQNSKLVQNVQKHLNTIFDTEVGVPDYFLKHYIYPKRDPGEVEYFQKRAAYIYQRAKKDLQEGKSNPTLN